MDARATPALLNTAPTTVGVQSRTSSAKDNCAAASQTSRTRDNTGPVMLASVSFNPLIDVGDRHRAAVSGEPYRARLRPMPDAAPLITAVRPLIVRLDLGNVAPRIPLNSDEPVVNQVKQPRAGRARRIASVASLQRNDWSQTIQQVI